MNKNEMLKNIINNVTSISKNAYKAFGSYLSASYILTRETIRYKCNYYTYDAVSYTHLTLPTKA